MSPYRRFDEKQEQTCRCLVLSSTRWLRLGVLRMLDGTRPGSSEKSMQMMFAGSAKRQLFAFAGLPPGICWLKAHAVMLAFFALHFGQFAHLQCQCRRRQGVSNFARSLQTRRPTLNQARTEHRWRHRALALWLVHEAKDEETQIVCAAWLGRHFESFWNLESRITVFSNLFCKADSASVTVTWRARAFLKPGMLQRRQGRIGHTQDGVDSFAWLF